MAAKKAAKKGTIDTTDGVSTAEASLAAKALADYQPPTNGLPASGHTLTLPDGRTAEIVQVCPDRRDLHEYAAEHVYLACRVIPE